MTARSGDNDGVTDTTHVRHIIVLPDRDAADEVAGELVDRFGPAEEPRPVREALAGEDDAEDAQWLVVLEPHQLPAGAGPPVAVEEWLARLAAEYDGWLEHE